MNQEEIRKLAIECGAKEFWQLVETAPKDAKIEFLEAIIAGDGAMITGLKCELKELKEEIKIRDDHIENLRQRERDLISELAAFKAQKPVKEGYE